MYINKLQVKKKNQHLSIFSKNQIIVTSYSPYCLGMLKMFAQLQKLHWILKLLEKAQPHIQLCLQLLTDFTS